MLPKRTLLLVRHGETAWNKEGRYQGQSDIPLSEVGRAQARALRARLEALAPHAHLFDPERTAVLTSDLRRAHETAELAFGLPGRTLHVDPALREYRYGIFEGLTPHEIDERHPGLMSAWIHGPRTFAMEGGESREAVHLRSRGAVTSFLERVAHPYVVVVAHGGVMRQLIYTCFGEAGEPARISYANTSMHAITVDGATWAYGGEL